MTFIPQFIKLLVFSLVLLIIACTPTNQSGDYNLPNDPNILPSWYGQSYDFFFNTSPAQIPLLAKSLNDLSKAAKVNDGSLAAQKPLIIENVLTRTLGSTIENEARLAIEQQRNEQFIAHQFASFGELYLSPKDKDYLQQNETWSQYIDSLIALGDEFDVFKQGEIDIYTASEEFSLFAYQRTLGNTRAFVAFNFSFDTVEVPLPFGFMTSTKITMWQSDSPKATTFVTSQALMIRPYTAVIIIVG